MPLPAGTKLGPHTILAPLGAGGMGEVYRARDSHLDREVAIKVLPEGLARDPERLARFEREAKVLASLNHPHIAQIYGIEEFSGGRALVMELVPGGTLEGPLPVEAALNYAKQIAEALEAAHEKGIIHRDLKPGNVVITPEGVAKVLDFGLAAVAQPSADGDPNQSPTLTIAASQAGIVMGTAAYMSPEQAAGRPVDKRADIWSFGVVLYEMLVGKRLFEGETISHTLADVLRAPIDMAGLPPDTPRGIRELLRRCLHRDPRKRLRDIGDARIAIEEALSGSDGEMPAATAAGPQKRAIVPWLVAASLAAALAAVAFLHFHAAPSARVLSATLLPPEGAEFDFTGHVATPALSPDGTRIVFGAKANGRNTELWLRRLDSPNAQPMPGTVDAEFPFWSPDSRWVAFGQEGKLKKIDTQGGPPVVVADIPGVLRGGSWSSQGVIVFGAGLPNSVHGLFRVAAAGGTAVAATTLEQGSRNDVFPWFLPDGRHFLYTPQQEGELPVRVGSLDEHGKPGKVVAQSNSTAVYAQGYLLYLRESTLMAQPFDPDRLETKGEAVPLAEGVPVFMQPSRPASFTVSTGGLLVYQSGTTAPQSTIMWQDRLGKTIGTLGTCPGQVRFLALSPDGKRLAVYIYDRERNRHIWIFDVARGIPTRLTFDPAQEVDPIWSPDGRTLYFTSRRRGSYDIFRKASDGASPEQLVLSDAATKAARSVSPDGKLLLYSKWDEKAKSQLWVLPLTANAGENPPPRVFRQTPFSQAHGQFSPDGHWVAYDSDESGRTEVYVAPFPGPGGARQISAAGGFDPRWRRDGKELFYVAPDSLMAAAVSIRNGTLEVGGVQKLMAAPQGGIYDVTADGQKFLRVESNGGTSALPLTLRENWPASLRK